MKEYGIGVIGMGWMGEAHSSAYRNYAVKYAHTGIKPKLIICSEILEERAKVACEKFGFETYSTNWRDVVDNPKVDIVDVTAPNALHLEIVEYALSKGKHVNCEKPLGAFPSDTLKAYEISRNAKSQTFIGFNYRWVPVVQKAKELLSSGAMGKIYHYKGSFFSCYAADSRSCYSWRFEKKNGLGAITDLLSHVIDMAHFLVGDIESTQGYLRTFIKERPEASQGASHYAKALDNAPMREVSNDDYVGASVKFKNGCVGFLDASRVFYGPTSRHCFEIFYEKGSILWNFEEMNTLNGKNIYDNIANAEVYNKEVIYTLQNPLSDEPSLAVLRGNLCPQGAIIKQSACAKHLLKHRGKALVYEDIETLKAEIDRDDLDVDENTVLVLKNAGPLGAPGMPEWGQLPIPKKLLKMGVKDILRISDARMSGTSYGACVLYVSPESFIGGNLALVQNGDMICIDVEKRLLEVELSDEELQRRKEAYRAPVRNYDSGYVKLYATHVTQAHEGCDFDFLSDGSREGAEPRIF